MNIPGVSVIIIAAGIVAVNIILRLQSLVVDRIVLIWEAIYPKASRIPVIGVAFRKIEQLRGTHKGNSTGRIGSRRQLAGGVSWGCSGGAQQPCVDHLHPI